MKFTFILRPFYFGVLLFIALMLNSCKLLAPTEIQRTTAMFPSQPSGLIPLPDFIKWGDSSFVLSANASIYVSPGTQEMRDIGQFLADKINVSTGFNIKVLTGKDISEKGNLFLTIGRDTLLGDEGYKLWVKADSVTLEAYQPAGLFRGVQTIRQLLPPSIESSTVQPCKWEMTVVSIRDYPRFEWRGAMLDVARHFFSVSDIKHFIDLIAYYKINRLHLHLTDDQGWRLMINSWPNLALIGGSTQVNGGSGGYYTQAEYAEIVAYAQKQYIITIPEIDMPGHTNAALASYPVLNENGVAPQLYEKTGVGFSTLSIYKDSTYTFIEDVIKELCTITPGQYIHIGGDEARATKKEDYIRFIERVQAIVLSHHKHMIGWEEISPSHLFPSTIVQHWVDDGAQKAVQQGIKIIMSPASKAYLDMKYNPSEVLGQDWAGCIEVKDAYMWDPASEVNSVTEKDVLGIEAPLWTETIRTMADIEYKVFPRLVGYAEIGWSQEAKRNWIDYKNRLAEHGSRLTMMGVNFYKSPQITW